MPNSPDYQLKQRNNHQKLFLTICGSLFADLHEKHRNNSMCSTEVLFNAYSAADYIARNNVQGDIVELGTWKGGAAALMAESLRANKSRTRLIVYDTFEGHPQPNPDEFDVWGNNMLDKYKQEIAIHGTWVMSSQKDVNDYLSSIYDHVEVRKEKISADSKYTGIDKISCLRLDMDWYEPTIAALNSLIPKMSKGSILIIDDYGHHSGVKEAVDEYFSSQAANPFFVNVNYSCITATF